MTDMSNQGVDPVAEAEAELAKAQADLAAAQQPPVPPAAPEVPAPAAPAVAESQVRLAVLQPWHVFEPGEGLPTVTFDGIYVSGSIAEQVLAAAEAQGVSLEQN